MVTNRLVAVAVLLALPAFCGCASTARQSIGTLPAAPASTQPAPAGESAPTQTAQQSGQGNLTAQLDAHGWKGLEYTTAVPVGQVILMGTMLLLSHRREVLRIKQNGKPSVVIPNGKPQT